MKKLKKILLIIVIIFLLAFVILSVFVAFRGKSIAKDLMQKSLNRKVELESIKARFPFSIEINNLNIENLVTAKRIIITPSIIGFVSGRLGLNQMQLIDPEFFLVRNEDASWNLPVSKGKGKVFIAGIIIKNGILNLIDKRVEPSGFSFKVKEIELNLHTSLLSTSPLNVSFFLKANVPSKDEKTTGTISADGWINWLKKDMKGEIKLTDLDALAFLPYYEKYLPSSLKSGRIFFNSDLIAKNNDLNADCHLKVEDLMFEKKDEEKSPAVSFLDIVTGGLKNENQEITLDFTVKTKLDEPRIDVAKLTGSVVAKSLGQSMIKNPEETIEKIKGIGKDFESFGKEMLKKKAEEIFGAKGNQEGQ
ncbi:MAG: DUF748 domain-containing protein [Candidatus Omnitrophota bacterium]|nr:DUF748 domain-containing protein [Candidatus Omnitrophota bacterium]